MGPSPPPPPGSSLPPATGAPVPAGLGANDLFGADEKEANEDSGIRFLKIGCIAAILGALALYGALLAVAATPTPTTGGSSLAAFLSLVQDLEIIVLVGALISAISSAFLFLGFRKLSNIESEFETPPPCCCSERSGAW